ncbi:MAG TPA: hypothetical protein PKK07_03150, partial [bacterium]|nr:hypothetical protein [bacterium]
MFNKSQFIYINLYIRDSQEISSDSCEHYREAFMYPYIFVVIVIAAISSVYFKFFFEMYKYQNRYKSFLIIACTMMVGILNTGFPFIVGILLSVNSKINELLKIEIPSKFAYFGAVVLYLGTVITFGKLIYGFYACRMRVEIAGNEALNYQVPETLETEPTVENQLEKPVDTTFNIDTIGLEETIQNEHDEHSEEDMSIDTRVEEMILDEESLIFQLHSIIVEEVTMIQL